MNQSQIDAIEKSVGRPLTDEERSALAGPGGGPFNVGEYGEHMFNAGYEAGLRNGKKTAGFDQAQPREVQR